MIVFISSTAFGNTFLIKQKQFIKDLYAKERYFDCITETVRLMNYDPQKSHYGEYKFFINSNFYLGKQYKNAIVSLASEKGKTFNINENILLSQSYIRVGNYSMSISLLNRVSYDDLQSHWRFRYLMMKIDTHLRGKSYGHLKKELSVAWNYIPDRNKMTDLRDEINRYNSLSFRSPILALSLSAIIPGLGQVISSRYLDGFLSLVSVAATAFGAYLSYQKENYGLSYTLMAFSVIFYSGNLYGAYNSAADRNLNLERDYNKRIRDKFIPEYDPVKDFKDTSFID